MVTNPAIRKMPLFPIPVSYTHLAAHFVDSVGFREVPEFLQEQKQLTPDDLETVSYTHLDVYKRQP